MPSVYAIRFDRELLAHLSAFEAHLLAEAKKTTLDEVNKCVLKLSFKEKYVFIKGKTAIGALKCVFRLIRSYPGQKTRKLPEDNLYLHFVKYFWEQTRGYTFKIKILLVSDNAANLLKCEQTWLWQKKSDPNCLNNTVDAYIPVYREETASFGWINKGSILTFQKWKKHNKPAPKPAKRGS